MNSRRVVPVFVVLVGLLIAGQSPVRADEGCGSALPSGDPRCDTRRPDPSIYSEPGSPRSGSPVTLSAGSPGRHVTFAWDLDDDGEFDDGSGLVVTRSFLAGTATIAVRATDEDGRTGVERRTLVVHAGNLAPRPSLGPLTPSNPRVGSLVRFNIFAADADGRVIRADFDLDGDGTYETVRESWSDPEVLQMSATFDTPGTQTVRVRLTDDAGATGTATTTVHVHEENFPPQAASVIVQPATPKPGEQVTVSARGTDPDGQIARYEFDLDGDGTYETDQGPTDHATTTFPAVGTRVIGVRVADDGGATAVGRRSVRVSATSEPPLVRISRAGNPRLYYAEAQDTDGSIAEVAWDLDGDGAFDDGASSSVTIPRAHFGPLELAVRVKADDGATATAYYRDDLRAPVPVPPALSTSPQQPRVGGSVSLFATVNTDDVVKVEWDLDGDGAFERATGEDPFTTASFNAVGDQGIGVRITDSQGRAAVARRNVNVSPSSGNLVPGAEIGAVPTSVRTGHSAVFYDMSQDGDGRIVSRAWDLDDDGEFDDGTGTSASRSFSEPGTEHVALRVTDLTGATSVQRQTIDVHSENRPPRARISPSSGSGTLVVRAGETAWAYASAYDTDDGVTTYAWDLDDDGEFDDGTSASALIGFPTTGVRRIHLRARDAGGLTDVTTAIVDVQPAAANRPPTVSFGLNGALAAFAGRRVSWLATGLDPDGDPITFEWDFDGDGAFDDGRGQLVSRVYDAPGTYDVRVRASDGKGGERAELMSITVNAPTGLPPYVTDFSTAQAVRPGRPASLFAWGQGADHYADATLSYDLDGDGEFDDVPVAASWTAASAAPLTIAVKATDPAGRTAVRTLGVQPTDIALAPIASIAPTDSPLIAGAAAYLYGWGSWSAPGQATFGWDLDGDGEFDDAAGTQASLVPAASGTATLAFQVIDSDGQRAVVTKMLGVGTAPPVASFTTAPASVVVGQPATFSSNASDPDGAPLAAETWDLDGDGDFDDASGAQAGTTFASTGTRLVGLKVRDVGGDTGIAYANVEVVEDTSAPDTTLRGGPGSLTRRDTATFELESTKPGRFECALDNAAWAACTSPVTLEELTDGAHVFRARAVDAGGTTDPSPARRTFRVNTWAPQRTVFSSAGRLAEPQVGADADGDLLATWLDDLDYAGGPNVNRVRVASRPAGGSWHAPSVIWPSSYAAGTPQLAVGPRGDAAALESVGGGFRLVRWTLGSVTSEGLLGVTGSARLAIDGGGRIVVVWEQWEGDRAELKAISTAPGGAWSAPVILARTTDYTSPSADLTLDDEGNVVAAWVEDAGVRTASMSGAGEWRVEPDLVPDANADLGEPRIAVDHRVGTVVTWLNYGSSSTTAYAATRVPGAAWQRSAISAPGAFTGGPLPVIDGSGTVTVAWSASTDNQYTFPVSAARRSAGNPWQTPQQLSPEGRNVDAGVDADGNVTVAWGEPSGAIKAATHAHDGGGWEPAVTINDAGTAAPALAPLRASASAATLALAARHTPVPQPHLLAAADGEVTVVWKTTIGAVDGIRSASTRLSPSDTTPPETTIASGPEALGNDATPTFEVVSSEPGASFTCALDDAPAAPCVSPFTAAALDDGEHRLSVIATDTAGNADPTPATWHFTVDTVAPQTTLRDTPAAEDNDATPRIAFDADDREAGFECALDGAAFAPCESPVTTTALSEGAHAFAVRARDRAGNIEAPPLEHRWRVDLTPPDVTVTTAPPELTNQTTAQFAFSSTDATAMFGCRLDAGAFAGCTSPAVLTGLADGEHRWEVRVSDPAGNIAEAGQTFTVDTTPPETTIDAAPEDPIDGDHATVRFSSEPDARFVCSVDGAAASSCTSPLELTGLQDGRHRVEIRAIDRAGNEERGPATASFEVDRTPPLAALALDRDEGPAPLAVELTITGSDAGERALAFDVDYGDGETAGGELPHAPLRHSFAEPGTYTVRYAVRDGLHETVATKVVRVLEPEPLEAEAGDDRVIVVGEPVAFDGGASRPSAGIERYEWDFGDGEAAAAMKAAHTYARAGAYPVKLTVHAGARSHSDSAVVTVIEPDRAKEVAITVRSGATPLAGAEALVIDAAGVRYGAIADASGVARIAGLPDGDTTVYGWRDGYRPSSVAVHVEGGRGEAVLQLDAGEVVATKTTAQRLDRDQILAAGINPDDPANQHVFQFEVHLAFENDPAPSIRLRGITTGRGGSDGDGPGHLWLPERWEDGRWVPCVDGCKSVPVGPGRAFPTFSFSQGVPTVQWLIIPGRATFLKEFFSIEMVVQNLAGPGISLQHGSAALELPAGLSLAPTATAQQPVRAVPDVPAGESRSASWIIRGDEEGSYDLSTTYTGTVEPFGKSMSLVSRLQEPLKVWAGSALKLIVQPENRVDELRPYRVRIGLHNVADVPVYNPAVELLREGRLNYIEQPRERMLQGAAVVEPGQTFWTDDYVLVPKITGRLVPQLSFVKKTAGDVDLENEIEPRAQLGVAAIKARPNKDRVVLDWQPVEGTERYEIYRTPDQDTDFPSEPLDVTYLDATRAVVNTPASDPPMIYAISSVKNGRNLMAHRAISAQATTGWESPTVRPRYDIGCDETSTRIKLIFEDQDFPLTSYTATIAGRTLTGELSGHRAEVDLGMHEIPATGLKVTGSARNELMGPGETGPQLSRVLRPCRYAAIGDSFSSGQGVPKFGPGNPTPFATGYEAGTATDEGDPLDPKENLCHRSAGAYGRLITKLGGFPSELDVATHPMTFRACSGALIGDILTVNQGDYTFEREPEGPQITQLDNGVHLATLTIGGNDAYFADVIAGCVMGRIGEALDAKSLDGKSPDEPLPFGRSCRTDYDAAVATEVERLRTRLPTVYRQVRDAIAPNGRVIVLTYPEFFPRGGASCWGMSKSDVNWMSSAQQEVNDIIVASAHTAGIEVVEIGDRFEGHDVCGLLPFGRWFNAPTLIDKEHSFHPNDAGQEAMANALSDYLEQEPPGTAFHIKEGESATTEQTVGDGLSEVTFVTRWPGSDIEMTIVTPSGKVLDRATEDGDLQHENGPTFETYTLHRPEPGKYQVRLRGIETEPDGEDVRLQVHQTRERNHEPSPIYTASVTTGARPLTVGFDGAAAFDVDGEIVSWSWDFGDGATATSKQASHTYAAHGRYEPRLTVVDNEGASASYSADPVIVGTPPHAADDALRTSAGQPLSVAGPGLLGNDTDADGDTLEAIQVQAPEHGEATVERDGRLTYTPTAGFTGTDRLRYVAVDATGAPSERATVTITVAELPGEEEEEQTSEDSQLIGSVAPTLSLTLGGADFGAFRPGVTRVYAASVVATVTSTAEDAALSVGDPSGSAPGRLVNGAVALSRPLRIRVLHAGVPDPPFASLPALASPLPLLRFPGPVVNDAATVEIEQSIEATEPLRTGTYSKAITFTLSTTRP